MKKSLSLSLTALLICALFLAACGKEAATEQTASPTDSAASTPGAAANADAEQAPVHLTFWAGGAFKNIEGYDTPNLGDWERVQAAAFTKLHPNVTIDVVIVPWNDINQKVNIAIAGNNAPDILFDSAGARGIQYAKRGLLEPLDDVIADERDDWKDTHLSLMTVDGKAYGLPYTIWPHMMFINRAIFDKKGLSNLLPQDRDWDWQEWKDAIKQVADDNVYGTAFFAKNDQNDLMTQNLIMGGGADYMNQDYSAYTLNSPGGVEALNFFVGMQDDGLVAPGVATMDYEGMQELFMQGKLATFYGKTDLYGTVEAAKKNGEIGDDVVPYAIVPVHKKGVQPRLTFSGDIAYMVFKSQDEAKQKMAKAFVKFVMSSDKVKAVSKSTLGIPARKSAEYQIDNQDYLAVSKKLDELQFADLGRDQPFYNKAREMFYPEIQAAFLKAKTPQQALDDFVQNANKLIGK